MLVDAAPIIDAITELADNWDQVNDYPARWGFSLLGVTTPVISKVRSE